MRETSASLASMCAHEPFFFLLCPPFYLIALGHIDGALTVHLLHHQGVAPRLEKKLHLDMQRTDQRGPF